MKTGAVFSRGSIICFGLLALALLLACRRFSKRFVAAAVADGQVQGRRAIVIGTREELAALGVEELLERFGLTEIARVVFSSDRNGGFAMTDEESSLLDRALAIGRESAVDEIVLALPWTDTRKLELVRDRLRVSPLPVQLVPDRRIRALAENPSYRLRRSLSIEIQRGPLSRAEQFSKRVVDIVGASLGLIILAPLMSRADILEDINRSGADLLILALNAKRGHSWISLNSPHLNVPVIAHLGSVINFVAGTIRRSPEFLQKTGLEWLWRIWEEPYLASRYARDFVDLAKLLATKAFPLLLLGPLVKLASSGGAALDVNVTARDGRAVIELKGSKSDLDLEGLRKALDQYQDFRGELVVCLREVSYVDPALLGLLIVARGGRLEKRLPVRIRSPRRLGARLLVHLHCADYLMGPPDD